MQLEFAEILKEAVPELESMRFCTSGTEATMYVTRVARAFSKKPVIVKAEGGWHGGNSTLSTGVMPPFMSKKSAPEGQKTIFVPYNNVEKTSEILEFHKDEIGGIIIEPMLGAGGGILASDDYLKMLRAFCDRNNTVLIFDEVITGFRFRYGSIAPLLGVFPDLYTFGKATAGGMHIGLYGGKKAIMDSITEGRLFVGIETLKSLKSMDYDLLNKEGEKLAGFIKEITKNNRFTAVTGKGSFFSLHFLKEEPEELTPAFIMANSDKSKEEIFKAAMLINDVFTMHSGGALSFKHLEEMTISSIKDAYIKSFEMLESV
jgi:glutamate-1-semialdehyde 2,1-aminomutase